MVLLILLAALTVGFASLMEEHGMLKRNDDNEPPPMTIW